MAKKRKKNQDVKVVSLQDQIQRIVGKQAKPRVAERDGARGSDLFEGGIERGPGKTKLAKLKRPKDKGTLTESSAIGRESKIIKKEIPGDVDPRTGMVIGVKRGESVRDAQIRTVKELQKGRRKKRIKRRRR